MIGLCQSFQQIPDLAVIHSAESNVVAEIFRTHSSWPVYPLESLPIQREVVVCFAGVVDDLWCAGDEPHIRILRRHVAKVQISQTCDSILRHLFQMDIRFSSSAGGCKGATVWMKAEMGGPPDTDALVTHSH